MSSSSKGASPSEETIRLRNETKRLRDLVQEMQTDTQEMEATNLEVEGLLQEEIQQLKAELKAVMDATGARSEPLESQDAEGTEDEIPKAAAAVIAVLAEAENRAERAETESRSKAAALSMSEEAADAAEETAVLSTQELQACKERIEDLEQENSILAARVEEALASRKGMDQPQAESAGAAQETSDKQDGETDGPPPETAISGLIRRVKAAEAESSSAQRGLAVSNAKLKQLETDLNDARAQIAQFDAESDEAQARLQDAVQAGEDANRKAARAQIAAGEAQQRLENELSRAKIDMETTQEQLREAASKLEQATAAHADEIAALQAHYEPSASTNEALTHAAQLATAELARRETENSSLCERLETSQQKIKAITAENGQLQVAIVASRADVTAWRRRAEESRVAEQAASALTEAARAEAMEARAEAMRLQQQQADAVRDAPVDAAIADQTGVSSVSTAQAGTVAEAIADSHHSSRRTSREDVITVLRKRAEDAEQEAQTSKHRAEAAEAGLVAAQELIIQAGAEAASLAQQAATMSSAVASIAVERDSALERAEDASKATREALALVEAHELAAADQHASSSADTPEPFSRTRSRQELPDRLKHSPFVVATPKLRPTPARQRHSPESTVSSSRSSSSASHQPPSPPPHHDDIAVDRSSSNGKSSPLEQQTIHGSKLEFESRPDTPTMDRLFDEAEADQQLGAKPELSDSARRTLTLLDSESGVAGPLALPGETEGEEDAESKQQTHTIAATGSAGDALMEELEAENVSLLRELHRERSTVLTFCRVRPANDEDSATESRLRHSSATASARTFSSVGARALSSSEIGVWDRRRRSFRSFGFDRALGPASSQAAVFRLVAPVARSVMEGQSACVIAYGITGSGKTHTMQGTPDGSDPGINLRLLHRLFALVERAERAAASPDTGATCALAQWTITVSMLEIYNEQLRDLLHPSAADWAKAMARVEASSSSVPSPGGGYKTSGGDRQDSTRSHPHRTAPLSTSQDHPHASSSLGGVGVGSQAWREELRRAMGGKHPPPRMEVRGGGGISSSGSATPPHPSASRGGVARVHISGLTKVRVVSVEEAVAAFERGNAVRATAATQVHEHSSRSHCVMIVDVDGPDGGVLRATANVAGAAAQVAQAHADASETPYRPSSDSAIDTGFASLSGQTPSSSQRGRTIARRHIASPRGHTSTSASARGSLATNDALRGSFHSPSRRDSSPVGSVSSIASSNRSLASTGAGSIGVGSGTLSTPAEAAGQAAATARVCGRLLLVDLAGAERLVKSGSDSSQRLRETKNINRSLSALGDVLDALERAGRARKQPSRKQNLTERSTASPSAAAATTPVHIPYRNSKLTQVLQDALSPHGRAVVVFTVTPSAAFTDETLRCMQFAQRVRKVDLGPAKRAVTILAFDAERKRLQQQLAHSETQRHAMTNRLNEALAAASSMQSRLASVRSHAHDTSEADKRALAHEMALARRTASEARHTIASSTDKTREMVRAAVDQARRAGDRAVARERKQHQETQIRLQEAQNRLVELQDLLTDMRAQLTYAKRQDMVLHPAPHLGGSALSSGLASEPARSHTSAGHLQAHSAAVSPFAVHSTGLARGATNGSRPDPGRATSPSSSYHSLGSSRIPSGARPQHTEHLASDRMGAKHGQHSPVHRPGHVPASLYNTGKEVSRRRQPATSSAERGSGTSHRTAFSSSSKRSVGKPSPSRISVPKGAVSPPSPPSRLPRHVAMPCELHRSNAPPSPPLLPLSAARRGPLPASLDASSVASSALSDDIPSSPRIFAGLGGSDPGAALAAATAAALASPSQLRGSQNTPSTPGSRSSPVPSVASGRGTPASARVRASAAAAAAAAAKRAPHSAKTSPSASRASYAGVYPRSLGKPSGAKHRLSARALPLPGKPLSGATRSAHSSPIPHAAVSSTTRMDAHVRKRLNSADQRRVAAVEQRKESARLRNVQREERRQRELLRRQGMVL